MHPDHSAWQFFCGLLGIPPPLAEQIWQGLLTLDPPGVQPLRRALRMMSVRPKTSLPLALQELYRSAATPQTLVLMAEQLVEHGLATRDAVSMFQDRVLAHVQANGAWYLLPEPEGTDSTLQ
jgi:hypothetical protein